MLPDEIVIMILEQLSWRDICTCALLNKRWARVALEIVWKCPKLDRIPFDMFVSWIAYWRFGMDASYHPDCVPRPSDKYAKPMFPYYVWIKELVACGQRDTSYGYKAQVRSPYPYLLVLPLCESLKSLDLSGLGRLQLCVVPRKKPEAESKLLCATRSLLEGLAKPAVRKSLRSLDLSSWNGRGSGDCLARDLKHRLICELEEDQHSCCLMLSTSQQSLLPSIGWTGLTSLNLSECYLITDRFASLLAQHLPRLKDLNLSSLPFITDATIMAFVCKDFYVDVHPDLNRTLEDAPGSRNTLQSINISFCPQLTEKSVEIVSLAKNLRTLNISHCPKLTENCLENIWCGKKEACNCFGSRLRSVSMVYLPVTDTVIENMITCGDCLEEIDLVYCKTISEEPVLKLLAKRGVLDRPKTGRNLVSIDVGFCDAVIDAPLSSIIYNYRNSNQLWDTRGCHVSGEQLSNLVKFIHENTNYK